MTGGSGCVERLDAASTLQLCLQLRELGRFDLNFRLLQLACNRAPHDPYIQRSWGLALCRTGDLAQGLEIYDRGRRQLPQFGAVIRPFPQPRWRGEDLAGKRLLLWAEQGVGDQVMQARCIADFLRKGAEITFECDPRLHPLLERSYPGIRCYTQRVTPAAALVHGDYHYQCSALSAWRWLYSRIESGRSGADWATPDAVLVQAYRAGWQQKMRRCNIGLSWYSKARATGAAKSLAPEDLAPLLRDADCRFHCLQYGVDAQTLGGLQPGFGRCIELDGDCDAYLDIDRLAARIAALDLVISIDNTTVHLAGAVGTPCWVMLPRNCDWRWGSTGSDTALYQGMRLFRQSQPGIWRDVVLEMQLALHDDI